MAEPPRKENVDGATRVLNYVILDWLKRHMDFDCQDDALSPPNPFQYPQASPQLFQYWPVPEYRYRQYSPTSLPPHLKYGPVRQQPYRLPSWPLHFQYGHGPLHLYRHPPWPLRFQSVVMIENRSYLLHLEKVPFAYLVHKFTVQCLQTFSSNLRGIVVDDISLHFPYGVVCEVYRDVCKVSENFEYLISLELTRVASRFNI